MLWHIFPCELTLQCSIGVTKRISGGLRGYSDGKDTAITQAPFRYGVPSGPSITNCQKKKSSSPGKTVTFG